MHFRRVLAYLQERCRNDVINPARPTVDPTSPAEFARPDVVRLAVDIGGTFTDVVLEHSAGRDSLKVLTTPGEPEQGVLTGVERILARTGIAAARVGLFVHGTTLATNAL
ncbi:MAG: hydantoinase/oxoprolinase N-terminal domain-containing protein, partial [Burkholderiaceae bacterium]